MAERYRGLKQGNRPVIAGTDRETRIANAQIEAKRQLDRIINPRVPIKQKLKAQRRLAAMGIDLTKQEGPKNEQ
jgi:hypothetical protein